MKLSCHWDVHRSPYHPFYHSHSFPIITEYEPEDTNKLGEERVRSRNLAKMAEEMSLPSDIVADGFAFEHESPAKSFGELGSSKLSPTTQQLNFLLDGVKSSNCTDCVVERFLDGVEKSFCMEWELNQATCSRHIIGSKGQGGEDEPRRSMSVYSDLVLEEIAQRKCPAEAITATSASSVPDNETLGEKDSRGRPILKLDTVMASAYAFGDPFLTPEWFLSAEETPSEYSVYVSPMDRLESFVASANPDESNAIARDVLMFLSSRHDQASMTALPAVSAELPQVHRIQTTTELWDVEPEPQTVPTQSRLPFPDLFKQLMKGLKN